MSLPVAAVIAHDRPTDRGVLLQHGEHARFARGRRGLPPAVAADPMSAATAGSRNRRS